MKILITGGLGFIGSHVSKKLVELGHDVFIYDNQVSRKVTAVVGAKVVSHKNFYFEEWDTIIHLAGKGIVLAGCDVEMIETNMIFAREVLRTPCRVLYASSAATRWPHSQYAWTKIYNESIANKYSTGFRFQNVYGERDNGIVGKMLRSCIYGKEMTIAGGEQKRDFVHVSDVVDCLVSHLESSEKIVEVGTGITTSVNQLIEMAERITGKELICNRIDLPYYESPESFSPTPLKTFISLEQGLSNYHLSLTL